MLVTDDGILTFVNDAHFSKALSPISVSVGGMSRLTNDTHPEKAEFSMLVTDSGIEMLFNEVQSRKAFSLIFNTPGEITIEVSRSLSSQPTFSHSFHDITFLIAQQDL
jgi:hypothetical protein